jgi:hypothetical protein
MSNNKPKLAFTITRNMLNAGIGGFDFEQNHFIFAFENNRKCTVQLTKNDQSISNTIKRIASTLAKNLNQSENEILEHCMRDIENQLVERRYEIFNFSVTNNPNLNSKYSVNTAIEDIALQVVLSVIESAKGDQIAVSTVVASVWSTHAQIQNYLGDTLTTRDNGRIRELYLRIIRHPNTEVIKHKPQLIVKWSDKKPSSKALDPESNPP